jgi:hypothetical protein
MLIPHKPTFIKYAVGNHASKYGHFLESFLFLPSENGDWRRLRFAAVDLTAMDLAQRR